MKKWTGCLFCLLLSSACEANANIKPKDMTGDVIQDLTSDLSDPDMSQHCPDLSIPVSPVDDEWATQASGIHNTGAGYWIANNKEFQAKIADPATPNKIIDISIISPTQTRDYEFAVTTDYISQDTGQGVL